MSDAAPRPRPPLPVRIAQAARVRPILLAALVAAVAVLALLQASPMRGTTRALVAWDAFVLVYMAGAAVMMARSPGPEAIRDRAEDLDYGQGVVLLVTVGGAVASLFAIVAELASARTGGHTEFSAVILSIATVALSWTFAHLVFALHYAHDFHGPDLGPGEQDTRGGLQFPGGADPDYGDFLYFAFVIGCACATADVNITSASMRRLAAIHGVVAFVFNTAIVALSINIAAGLVAAG